VKNLPFEHQVNGDTKKSFILQNLCHCACLSISNCCLILNHNFSWDIDFEQTCNSC